MVRSQNWFKDRNGKSKCNFCGKGRHDKFANYCRQCAADAAMSLALTKPDNKVTYRNVFKHEPENNIFHDVIKVLEDSPFSSRD